jgi:hypothetical protein
MIVYVVTVQGRFVDVFLNEADAEKLKKSLYMAGHDGIAVISKSI